MDLYVLRHAIAVDHGTPGYEDDSLRPLTGKGAKKMKNIAEGMLILDVTVDVIFSSPFMRAKQTGEIVAKAFHAQKNLVFTPLLEVGGDPEKLVEYINEHHDSDARVMLVGHEPYLSSMISVLISGNGSIDITMKKGGLCKLKTASLHYGQCATLEWLLTPIQLTHLR